MPKFIRLTYEIRSGFESIKKSFAVNVKKIESFEDGVIRTTSGNLVAVLESADEIWRKIDAENG